MLIRACSDIHLEFHFSEDAALEEIEHLINTILPPLETDISSVLVIAGDLGLVAKNNVTNISRFLQLVHNRFKHVIYVLGNHEHYRFWISRTYGIICDEISKNKNIDCSKITIAGNEPKMVKIDDFTFMCGTLWTDYDRGNPMTIEAITSCINDHHVIMDDESNKLPAEVLMQIHASTIGQFKNWMGEDDSKVVVVTHHLPSHFCVDEIYKKNSRDLLVNSAFASNLDSFIFDFKPALWIYGHTHRPLNEKLGDTLLFCNPLGYPGEHNLKDGRYSKNTVLSV